MLKKIITLLVCIAIGTTCWGATTYQIQTKLNNIGGSIQIRNNAIQSVAGNVGYNNFTTSAPVPGKVMANTGYKITVVTKTGVSQTISDDQLFTTNFLKSDGAAQSLIATFAAKQFTVTAAATGPGSITPTSSVVAYGANSVLSLLPSGTGSLLTAVSEGTLTDTSLVPVSLPYAYPAKLTISNVTANKNISVTYITVGVTVPADQTVSVNKPVELTGTVTGGGTPQWSQVSGPAVSINNAGTLTMSFTPTISSTYVFKLTESLGGKNATVQITVVDSILASMRTACNGCHNPAGVVPSNAFANWSSSSHKTSETSCITCHTNGAMPTPVHTGSVNSSTFVITYQSAGTVGNNFCSKCHIATIADSFAASPHKNAGLSCVNCHTKAPHNSDLLVDISTKTGSVNKTNFSVSGGATICAKCHTVKGNSTHYFAQTAITANCSDCHVSAHNAGSVLTAEVGKNHFNGYTSPQNDKFRAAYVTTSTACSDCHRISNSVLDQGSDPALLQKRVDWASSKHGDNQAQAFLAKNFKNENGCVRCHTSRGFIAYSSARMQGAWGNVTDQSRNPITCNGCHYQDFSVRVLAHYSSATAQNIAIDSNTTVALSTVSADYGLSNLCVPCHSGLASGKLVKEAVRFESFTAVSRIDSHFLAGAAILNNNVGYEFEGTPLGAQKDFNKNNTWHAGIGLPGVKSIVGSGPCIACHMGPGEARHTFTPVFKNQTGNINAIVTISTCNYCHPSQIGNGEAMTASRLQGYKDGYKNALQLLKTELQAKGFDPDGPSAPDWGSNLTARSNNAGAFFNYRLLSSGDTAGYVHNPSYVKKLIELSIDWLDDGLFNHSIAATIALLPLPDQVKDSGSAYLGITSQATAPSCYSCHRSLFN